MTTAISDFRPLLSFFIVKSLFCIAAILAPLFAPVIVSAQSSTDYQAALRAATEPYRGDSVETSDTVVYSEYSTRPVTPSPLNPFPAEPFTLRSIIRQDSGLHSLSLQIAIPDQQTQPTATWRVTTVFDDYNILATPDTRRESSVEIQAAIREAIENYRGDCTEIVHIDRQYFYGSFSRDLCNKYLTIFAEFKFTRTFFGVAPGEEKIVGTWRDDISDPTMRITFRPDHSFIIQGGDQHATFIEGSWRVEDGQLLISRVKAAGKPLAEAECGQKILSVTNDRFVTQGSDSENKLVTTTYTRVR